MKKVGNNSFYLISHRDICTLAHIATIYDYTQRRSTLRMTAHFLEAK